MKNLTVCFKSILLLTICFLHFSGSPVDKDKLPDPKIQSGIARVTGRVIDHHLKAGEEPPTISLNLTNQVTGGSARLETRLNDDGRFQFEVPVQCSKTIATIYSPYFKQNDIFLGLVPGEETKVELVSDNTGMLKPKVTGGFELTPDVTQNYIQICSNFLDAVEHEPYYQLTPEEFSHLAVGQLLVNRLKTAIADTKLSEKGLNLATNECKLRFLAGCLLSYDAYITMNYNNFKAEGEPDHFTPQQLQRSYFSFLKKFNLNDPQYLYTASYRGVIRAILSNEALNIPLIKDMPINDWLKVVRATMADLIGSDTGLFYDMLVADAYEMQFDKGFKPLSDKQITNIKSYFKNEDFTKILLNKNDEIIKLTKGNEFFKTVENKTPAVPKEALMKAIVSKYKGKMVLVDFWATWCGPCMNAMIESHKIKSEMKGKNIVFVYLTDSSSPEKLWKMTINSIGGEQYYLTSAEMDYLRKSLDFTGIPTYLFYDKNGNLKDKITGYPGSLKMKEMIERLL